MIPRTNTPHTLGRKGLATEVTEEETDALVSCEVCDAWCSPNWEPVWEDFESPMRSGESGFVL